MLKKQTITVLIIGAISIFLVLYDLFALFAWGVDSTISVVLNQWAFTAHPLIVFIFGMIFGGIITHLLKWKPK